jgi:hypothetical protein
MTTRSAAIYVRISQDRARITDAYVPPNPFRRPATRH